MSPGSTSEEHPPAHVTIEADAEPHHAGGSLTNANGWDGKLRMPKSAILTNPEAVSDPEYSDDENVLPGEEIAADEGLFLPLSHHARSRGASRHATLTDTLCCL